ncbi:MULTISPECIES: SUMF1/EgtB/PvdO family nonheme iron enzyme [unclassified Candidatus Cardinium]|uniref:SUMF1/EgtB/PvdO family nonheme iron enzyme n=1 Tax=unclassified Candidatus Cardinium TaxID=2641185 RepID=UPI001FB38577|nr:MULTISPECIES: SUMF1/EgtB/PvdO family nonheme iron enzyme [unclassified Candidatus Cardinium]
MTIISGIARLKYFLIFLALAYFTAYGKRHPSSTRPGKVSLTTGRPFNQADTLPVVPSKRFSSIPGMVYIEGGYMVMGNLGEDKLGTGGRYAKPVTVNSFYMDQTPITNLDYREYLYDLKKNGLMDQYQAAIPDQKVWAKDGSICNDQYIDNYLYAPGFMYYPVVGVTWVQATEYCKWRTAKFKEEKMKRQTKRREAKSNPAADDDAYAEKDKLEHVEGNEVEEAYPVFRLATEAEWEYAARAIVGIANVDYLQSHQSSYPWSSSSPRGANGQFLANFKRGKGNYKGMCGESDHAAPTSYVYAYPPNDLGIYDMVGNVCCWVNDTYSPLSLQDTGDLNPVKRDESLGHAGNDYIASKAALTNDDAKVYKGCSWADCAYFLQIGTRRYLQKEHASATIGFRCVVCSLG